MSATMSAIAFTGASFEKRSAFHFAATSLPAESAMAAAKEVAG